MASSEELREVAEAIANLAERVADLTLDTLRAQAQGNDEAKATERALSSARRSLIKAETTIRGVARD